MTHPAGPPPFKRVGFRAEPIDPERFNAEQEYARGYEAGLAVIIGKDLDAYAQGKQDAMRELRESEEWAAVDVAITRNLTGSVLPEWESLRKRVEGGG